MEAHRRVCARIDLDAVEQNLAGIENRVQGEAQVLCVVKTDGYGHGALPIARMAQERPSVWGFAVATAEEALELREAGIYKPVLILGYTFPESDGRLLEADVRETVFQYGRAQKLSAAASAAGRKARIHIAVDTGMGRIGLPVSEEGVDVLEKIAALEGIEVEGIFTHFSKADEWERDYTQRQIEKFTWFIQSAEDRGVHIPLHHCSNSAGIMEYPQAHMDMVRAGIILYGIYPSSEVHRENLSLQPAMELKSHIVYIKDVEAGQLISYGGTYCAGKPMRVATIPVGYGDGYPRSLSNRGWVLIRGKKAPILGRICMDQFMVDVTDIPEAQEEDEVTLLGRDGEASVGVEELSSLSGRFPYELVCCVGKRVPRTYIRRGKKAGGPDME